MATIKSFTDLQQSKKLAEILPTESADMYIGNYIGKSGKVDGTNIHYYTKGESFGAPEIIDAWSLAALISILPIIRKGEDTANPFIAKTPDNEYHIVYATLTEEVDTSPMYDNPIDACVTMIESLHELNLL